jgi:hypothetical protein
MPGSPDTGRQIQVQTGRDWPERFARLAALIRRNAVRTWVDDRLDDPSPENLTYLVKFAYLTGLINKAQIRDYLDMDRIQAKKQVREWYDQHRQKGCGMC